MEELLKATVLIVGKHSGSFAANVKQGVCMLLPEHVKISKKRIQATYNKVVSIQDEIKKTKTSFSRLLERQQRTIKEAEQILLAANSEEDTQAPEDERTFTKMISKISGEKKGLERYRELLKELEGIESQLQSECRRINVSRSELSIEISKAFKELEEQEVERLQIMREGISRFLLSLDLNVKCQLEAFAPAEDQLRRLDLRGEIDAFLGRSVPIDGGSFPSVFRTFELESEKSKFSVVIQQVSIKADRMAEILDFFQALTQRLNQGVVDAEGAEAVDVKAATKVIERSGFPRLPMDESLSENSRVNSGVAQLMLQELPTTRTHWETLFNIVGHLVEGCSRTMEFYSEEASQQFDLIQKRIIMCKKDLAEKHTIALKKIETSLQEVGRIRTKLSKLRQQIKERKQTLRNIKGGNNTADVPVINGDPEDEGEITDEDNTTQEPTSAIGSATPNSSMASSFAAGFGRRATLKAFESFNSTLRGAANLKQVVGLETAADRISRVEAQIVQLEDEDRLTLEQERNSIRAYEDCLHSCHQELEQSVSLTVEIFLADVDTLKRALSKYLNWQKEKFANVISTSKQLKEAITRDANDVKDDYHVVYHSLMSRDNFFEGELFEIPPGENFEGHKLEKIDDDEINESPVDDRVVESDNREDIPMTPDGKRAIPDDIMGSPKLQESPSKFATSAEFELKKFGLSSQDKVLESYSCALYPKKGLLTHGR